MAFMRKVGTIRKSAKVGTLSSLTVRRLRAQRRHEQLADLEPKRGGLGTQTFAYGQNAIENDRTCDDVDSTAISSIGYNNGAGRLEVTFQSGRSYAYYNVSRQRYQAFCNADSKGRYFNKNIRNGYAYAKLG